MNRKSLKPTTLFIIILAANLFIYDLYGYTFFVAGETIYYFLADGENFYVYENQSNKQEVHRYLSDGTIIARNTALMKNFYTEQPWPYQGEEVILTGKYYTNEKNDQYMNTVTMDIIKNAATLDDAVLKIGVWLRQNVSYSLGTSTDPMSIYKTKRAFCEGYKNLAVELFNQAGFAAAGITCYVPPGHGWGFGNSGGNHAFVQYYYPGYGWVCVDPQSTVNFADPYHIINFGAGNFIKDLKIVDNSYVTDYQEEPKSWETFTACGKKTILHPVLIFKIADLDGRNLRLPLFSFTSTIKELNRSSYSMSGFSSGVGLDVERYTNGFSVVTSSYSPYSSYLFTQPGIAELKGSDVMVIDSGSCLYIQEYAFNGNGNYFFEADFRTDPDVKRVRLYSPGGNALANQLVEVTIGTGKYSMTSDADGRLGFKIPGQSISITVNGSTYPVSFREQGEQYVPGKPDRQARVAAFLDKKKAAVEKPAVFCVVYDRDGNISNNTGSTMQVYAAKTKLQPVKKEDGLFYSDNFQLNRDYYILVNAGNTWFRRKVNFAKNELVRFEFSEAIADNALSLAFENTMDDSLVFYEYFDTAVLNYPVQEGKIYLDFPEGLYLFADNSKGEKIIPVTVTGGKKELVYSYSSLGFDDYLTVKKLRLNTGTGLAGAVTVAPYAVDARRFEEETALLENAEDREFLTRLYKKPWEWSYEYNLDEKATAGERRRIAALLKAKSPGAVLTLVNLNTGKTDKVTADGTGYFFQPTFAENTDYLLCYAVNAGAGWSGLYMKQFRTGAKGLYTVNLEESGEPVEIRKSAGKDDYYSTLPLFYLLLPRFAANKVTTGYLEFKMSNRGRAVLFPGTSTLLFGADKSLLSARSITPGSGVQECVLTGGPGQEGYLDSLAMVYSSFYPADKCLLLIRVTDADNKSFVNTQFGLFADKETKFTTDKNGCAVVEGLAAGTTYNLRYAASGIYLDYPLAPVNAGVNTAAFGLTDTACYTFTAKKTTGALELCFPKVVKDELSISTTKLLFDKQNALDLYLAPGTYFFKIGTDKILADYTFDKSAKQSIDFNAARDALQPLQKMVTALFADKPAYIIRLTENGKPLVDYTAQVSTGKRKTAYKALKDGLFYITNPGTDELTLEYKADGSFIRKVLPAAAAPQTCIIDIKKQANLLVTLGGKKATIKNRAVNVYTDAAFDDKQKLKYKEKLILKTDAAGQAYITLPDGKYYMEANTGAYESVDIQEGKLKKLTVKVTG